MIDKIGGGMEDSYGGHLEGGQQHARDISDVNGTQISGLSNSTSFTKVQPLSDN